MPVNLVGAEKTKEKKVVLLFVPEEIQKRRVVLQLLHIEKEAGKLNYRLSAINRREVHQYFGILPDAAKSLLLRFQPEQLINLQKETEQRVKKQKAGVSLQVLLKQSLYRFLHQQFQELKPFFAGIRSYHKIQKDGSKLYQTLPCSFRAERPGLRFEVIKKESTYGLNIQVIIDGFIQNIDSFTRTEFFLEKDNEYFLLSFNDYQTLEWLNETLGEGLHKAAFAEKVIKRLEENYTLYRKDLLDEKKVTVAPQCRVLLSELNNAFLLLTPQWLYDGMLVEGPWREKHELTIAGERVVIQRDKEIEQEFLQMLASFHPHFASQRNGYYYLSFADAGKKQWFIKTYYSLLDRNVEIAGTDMLHHFRYSPHKAETTVMLLREEGSLLHLRMTVSFGKEAVAIATLQKALYAGQRALVLRDGSLGVLSDEWLAQYAALLKHSTIRGSELQVSKFLSLGENDSATSQPAWRSPLKEEWWEAWKKWQSGTEPLISLPASIKATLRPYQQKGFEWLALLSQIGSGACLADDMGLGKTLQTICFLAWYSSRHPGARHLVVCPTSLLYNWQNELQKFAPSLRTKIYHGAVVQEEMASADIIITTYGTLRANSEGLLSYHFGVAVIDESHNIKNPSAQITRIIQGVQATVRVALSGTPVVNNTFDLYSQLNFAVPNLLGNREFFKREYANCIDRFGDEAKIKALQQLTAPFILRRTKEQVATDLPSKTEAILWCTMSTAQEELYNEIKEQVRSNLFLDIQNNGLQKSKLAVLQGMLKLRQICNHPLLLPEEEHGGRLLSAKTDVLMEELANLLGRHKVLLFSQFSSMLHLLAKECDSRGIRYFLLDGQTPAEKRAQMVKAFQENAEAPPLFFISLKAGNTGLTLTAADYVFLFDPWWNTAVEQQAIDRTHRIGQTKNVFSYKLVCKNSIEEKILALQQRKKHLADELISAEEDFVKNLGAEEIRYLFS